LAPTRRIFPPSRGASAAERVRKGVIGSDRVSDARTLGLALRAASVRMRATGGRDVMGVTWVFPSRRLPLRA